VDARRRTRASKLLSLILRHEPARFGVALAPGGWTDVTTILAALAANGLPLGRDDVLEVVSRGAKPRFELTADGSRIRATHGHSAQVDLGYVPAVPPERLFHGTPVRAVASIRAGGLRAGERLFVHLAESVEAALAVGRRRGRAVVLGVRASDLARAGRAFYRTQGGVWLTEHVPPEYVEPLERAS
jgi:putative RNA 2'-phosphotransferase